MARNPTPVPPLPEPGRPELYWCLHHEQAYFMNGTDFNPSVGYVDLVRRENAEQAYIRDPLLEEVDLSHHGTGWGKVIFAHMLRALADGVYQMPQTEDSTERVAIKCLNFNAVELHLQRGGLEDPYKEINRMFELGRDDIHVLGCIEVLRDEHNLYIVMPYCEGGSLRDLQDLTESQALPIFVEILKTLWYIRDHHIGHRDLSPDNVLIRNGKLFLTDFARSYKLPADHSVVIPDRGVHGKPPFQPPEVFMSSLLHRPYDVFQCDLWAAGIILFCLSTSKGCVYEVPFHTDYFFRCFFLARGVSGTYTEQIEECLRDADNLGQEEIPEGVDAEEGRRYAERISRLRGMRSLFATVQGLSTQIRLIMENVLNVQADERWDLDNTLRYITGGIPS